MSDIITTYQQMQQLNKPERSDFAFATVVSVATSGLTVRFDGEAAASSKRFRRNTSITFTTGQRVLMVKVNGQYVVLCPVG